jgi:hypothetical protein
VKQQMVEERNILKVELLDVKSSLVGKLRERRMRIVLERNSWL